MAANSSFAQFSNAPIYNTKAVARETGVPPDTFRAWERRYGVPQPQRTQGGHRLYSERDIAVIRWLRDRTGEGMNISHAVMLLERAPDEPVAAHTTDQPRSLEQSVEQVIMALTHFDGGRAEILISEAFALHPFERVLLDLIQPAMVEIGERWHRGEINIAAEHYTTEFVRRKLASLLNVFEGQTTSETIIVGCAPRELHDIGIMFASLFLVRRGYHVVYLGPQVPLNDLLETVRTVKPQLVCLSASTLETALLLRDVVEALVREFPDVRVGYGGRIFNQHPELRGSMGGSFLGQDARELVDTISGLSRNTPSNND